MLRIVHHHYQLRGPNISSRAFRLLPCAHLSMAKIGILCVYLVPLAPAGEGDQSSKCVLRNNTTGEKEPLAGTFMPPTLTGDGLGWRKNILVQKITSYPKEGICVTRRATSECNSHHILRFRSGSQDVWFGRQ